MVSASRGKIFTIDIFLCNFFLQNISRASNIYLPTGNGGEQRPRAGVARSREPAATACAAGRPTLDVGGAGKEPPPQAGTRREKGGEEHRIRSHRKDNSPSQGFPAKMALCESAGRKAAGGGDESAARVDARHEQPVKPISDFCF